jgi:AcrR family transcriptional regulator
MTEHLTRDVRREQILDAATKMFVAQGYENSTVDEIAHEAGLSKGSIYWYFKSKLDILFALTDRCIEDCQHELIHLAESTEMGPEAFFRCHRNLCIDKLQKPEHDQLFGQLVALAPRHPEIRERLANYYYSWDRVVEKLIKNAVDNGFFRNTNTLHLAQAVSAMYDGLFQRRDVDPTIDMIAVLETTTRLLYDALVAHQNADVDVEETR